MAQLAIRGHATRGYEVIEILEMLGGKNKYNIDAIRGHHAYFIENGIISTLKINQIRPNQFIIFILEEFLEKFPYKGGDKVSSKYLKNYKIEKMEWEDTNNRVIYKLQAMGWYSTDELQPYKEETMEEKLMPKIDFNDYCKDKYLLDLGNYEIKEENGKTYVVRKQPQYPKTYEECCKVLGISPSFGLLHDDNRVILAYGIRELAYLQELLICRDAYWKIAGEQMGLRKPWEPRWNDNYQKKWIINFYQDEINLTNGPNVHFVLAFPTKEMRDAFFENFKELIKECINLL